MHEPDIKIPFGEEEARIAGARLIINGDDIIFWRHGSRDLWEYPGGGFLRIDPDLGAMSFPPCSRKTGDKSAFDGTGRCCDPPDAGDWHLVAESFEGNEAQGGLGPRRGSPRGHLRSRTVRYGHRLNKMG